MKIIKGKPLADFTTFRIGGKARFFCTISDIKGLKRAIDFAKKRSLLVFVLGGGSNILVSDKGFDGLVIKIEIKGIEELESKDKAKGRGLLGLGTGTLLNALFSTKTRFHSGKRLDQRDAMHAGQIFIRAGAGENWDDLVSWTVDKGYGGLENLSLIPGTVGAAPVQNIGAYGIEASDLIEEVEAFDIREGIFKSIAHGQCGFSYRDSVFKREKGRYVITSVLFKLDKKTEPNISYKDLKEYFSNSQESGIGGKTEQRPQNPKSQIGSNDKSSKPSIVEVREAVVKIRTIKLPDLHKVGTAGSFFKNPIVSREKYAELKEKYPELPSFFESDGRIKIPIAWIIDNVCGLKGKRFGNAGIHEKQALVIVNHGGATFEDVEKAAKEVEKMVKEKTGIEIEREVVMV
jgi:UDP-N-acetylmuramate dehydrogenase